MGRRKSGYLCTWVNEDLLTYRAMYVSRPTIPECVIKKLQYHQLAYKGTRQMGQCRGPYGTPRFCLPRTRVTNGEGRLWVHYANYDTSLA